MLETELRARWRGHKLWEMGTNRDRKQVSERM